MSSNLPTSLLERKIRRLSLNQLKALALLCQQKDGLISSTKIGGKLGLKGKSLGGIFSSLSRQRMQGRPLIIPFGREPGGRGLYWRINPDLADPKDLYRLISSILKFWHQ